MKPNRSSPDRQNRRPPPHPPSPSRRSRSRNSPMTAMETPNGAPNPASHAYGPPLMRGAVPARPLPGVNPGGGGGGTRRYHHHNHHNLPQPPHGARGRHRSRGFEAEDRPDFGGRYHPDHHQQQAAATTPICRCRVLYLGSAVPHVTKDGLQGIQEPLRELYPEVGALGARGIDSWLSVWSNGFLLENVDENQKKVTRFFPIESLHYCAAVRYVLVPRSTSGSAPAGDGGPDPDENRVQRFLPLDSPFARNPSAQHPPLFAAILRRTTGIKVLECHAFICKRETAANALVRCSFHSYADSTYAKHLEGGSGSQSIYGTLGAPTPVPSTTPTTPGGNDNGVYGTIGNGGAAHHHHHHQHPHLRPETPREYQQSVIEVSEDSINSIERADDWNSSPTSASNSAGGGPPRGRGALYNGASSTPRENGNGGAASPENLSAIFSGDENHKVWAGRSSSAAAGDVNDSNTYDYGSSTLRSFRSNVSGLSHKNRPRQLAMPSSPPPPPIPEESGAAGAAGAAGASTAHGDEPDGRRDHGGKRKKRRSRSRDGGGSGDHHVPKSNGSMLLMNGGAGSGSGFRKHSTTSSLMNNGHGPLHPRGGHIMHGPPLIMIPPPGAPPGAAPAGVPPGGVNPGVGGEKPGGKKKSGKMQQQQKSGTFSVRTGASHPAIPQYMLYGGYYGPVMMPPLVPPPPQPVYGMVNPHLMSPPSYGIPMRPPPFHHHHLLQPHHHHHLHHGGVPAGTMTMEEPAYMPQGARPLSPIASYQPGHFPHEAYYNNQQHHPQQYATIDKANRYRNNPNNSRASKAAAAAAATAGGGGKGHNQVQQSSESNGEDSEEPAAAYKRGHGHERGAFPNSIRNEHRSRSYGSLANGDPLLVNGNGGGGLHRPEGGEEGPPPPMVMGLAAAKQRGDLAQMMTDLDLGEDTIERSEVPPGLYPPPPPLPTNGHPQNSSSKVGNNSSNNRNGGSLMAAMMPNGPTKKKR